MGNKSIVTEAVLTQLLDTTEWMLDGAQQRRTQVPGSLKVSTWSQDSNNNKAQGTGGSTEGGKPRGTFAHVSSFKRA